MQAQDVMTTWVARRVEGLRSGALIGVVYVPIYNALQRRFGT